MIDPFGRPNCGIAFVSWDSTKTRSPLFWTFRGGRSTGRAVVTVASTRIVTECGPVVVELVPVAPASDESSSDRTTYAPIATRTTTATPAATMATTFARIPGGYRRPRSTLRPISGFAAGVGP